MPKRAGNARRDAAGLFNWALYITEGFAANAQHTVDLIGTNPNLTGQQKSMIRAIAQDAGR